MFYTSRLEENPKAWWNAKARGQRRRLRACKLWTYGTLWLELTQGTQGWSWHQHRVSCWLSKDFCPWRYLLSVLTLYGYTICMGIRCRLRNCACARGLIHQCDVSWDTTSRCYYIDCTGRLTTCGVESRLTACLLLFKVLPRGSMPRQCTTWSGTTLGCEVHV